ncbi:MAG: PEGA domain-containing protein [Polyangiales bacterium]
MLRGSFFAVLALVLIPAMASAQDARERFQRGQVAYDQGDYEVALTEWRAAYELDAQPLIQFNIAQAAERLGQLPEAATALDLYLSTAATTDPNQANARARRSALRERLAQTGVRLAGGPSGAAISIDGTEWGLTPRPDAISLEPGSHRIEVSAEGFETFRSTVVVPAGQTVDVSVEMTAREVTPPVDTPPSHMDPIETRVNTPVESSGPGATPWIVAGAGVVLVGAAAALGAVALGKANDAPGSESDEADSARTLGLTADILGITGAVAISAGLIWYFVGRNSGADEETVRVSPYAGPDRAGLDAQWSF